jgi:hypothetical protein
MLSRQNMTRSKANGEYYEKHHIVPRCLGGSNEKQNLVLLTAKEHFLAHRILYKIYPNDRNIAFSFWGMCNQMGKNQSRYIPNASAYQEARLAFLKYNTGDNNPKGFLGKSHTKNTKLIQSISNKNKVYTQETRDKIRATKIGLKYSQETNLKKGKKDENHPGARALKHIETGLDFLTLKSASQYFNVSRKTIYNWIDKKSIVSL